MRSFPIVVACGLLFGTASAQAGDPDLCVRGPQTVQFTHLVGGRPPVGVEIRLYNCGDPETDLNWTSSVSGDLAQYVTVTPSSGVIRPGQGYEPDDPRQHGEDPESIHRTQGQQAVVVTVDPTRIIDPAVGGTLTFTNENDLDDTFSMPISLIVGQVDFIPGDKLIGNIGSAANFEAAAFNGLRGMKLQLKIRAQGGPTRLLVTILDENDVEMKSWNVRTNKNRSKQYTLKSDGLHKVRVESGDGSIGPYAILTGQKMPSRAKPKSLNKVKADKGTTWVDTKFAAVPGAYLSANILPVAPLEPGEVNFGLTTPAGSTFNIQGFEQESLVGRHLLLVPIGEVGVYKLRVSGLTLKGDRVTIPVIPFQPVGDSTVDIDA